MPSIKDCNTIRRGSEFADRHWEFLANVLRIAALNAFVFWRAISDDNMSRFSFIYDFANTLVMDFQFERASSSVKPYTAIFLYFQLLLQEYESL